MKAVLGYGVFFLAAYLFFLLITVPADRAFSLVHNRLPAPYNTLTLTGPDGTAWSGRAASATYKGMEVRDIRWSLLPMQLLLGRLAFDLSLGSSEAGFQGEVSFSRQCVIIRQGMVHLPLTLLRDQIAAYGVRLAGTLTVDFRKVRMDEGRILVADGVALWSGAEVVSPQNLKLGDLRMEFVTDDEQIEGVLTDGGGPLAAEGILNLAADGRYRFNASLLSRDPAQPALEDTLRLLGKAGRDGKIHVAHSGMLPQLAARDSGM